MRHTSTKALRHSGVVAEFVKMFRPHISSTMNDPSFPSDFIKKSEKEEGEAPTTVPDKLTLNFFLPHETTMKDSKVRVCPGNSSHRHTQHNFTDACADAHRLAMLTQWDLSLSTLVLCKPTVSATQTSKPIEGSFDD